MLEGMVFRLDYRTKVTISRDKNYDTTNVTLTKESRADYSDYVTTETFTVSENSVPELIKALQLFQDNYPKD